ncbi:MAG TPA: glycosyltransferase family 39 protein [Phycisphaerae bacterium]|nr:glycosyltransferase family 39 protein [Phycisphaerae bacterium]
MKISPEGRHRHDRRLRFISFVVLVAAVAARLSYLIASPDRAWPHSVAYEGDAPLWARFADALLIGQPFEFDLPVHPPGVAYLLSWLPNHESHGYFLAAKVIWCLLGALSCALTIVAARPHFGLRVAALAGLLSAASFGLIVQSTSLNNETPYTLLLLITIIVTNSILTAPSVAKAVLWGLCNGFAVLLRPEHTLLVVLLLGFLALRRRSIKPDPQSAGAHPRRIAIPLAVAVVCFFLVPLPWSIRSARALLRFNTVEAQPIDYARSEVPWTMDAADFLRALPAFAREGNWRYITYLAQQKRLAHVDREFVQSFFSDAGYIPKPISPFVFVSNQGPLCFALANNEHADGGFSTALLGTSGPSVLAFGSPWHLRLYQEGYAVGMRYLLDHPRDAVELFYKKLLFFAEGASQGFTVWNFPLGVEGIRRPVDQLTAPITNHKIWATFILTFVAAGIALALRRRITSFWLTIIAYKLIIAIAFFGYARQAVSILPVFYVFAAVALDAVLLSPLAKRWPILVDRWRLILVLTSAGVFATAARTSFLSWKYEISGPADSAPQWGPGAFESHQALNIRRL